ncbi:membrane protein [Streptococcus criceti]|uniref:Uncharacterized protein n=1 Tax=Streptococcus criceti HS-6 TaxID=873449 RepID=G5JNT8_STRCG|nr:hypothetical protein [Streptococcus criceti]EHI75200.1 hypothetical protein STRCR_0251 [Streptococcus criceti HS-6]SUN41747.1 membrane protein [Streptococcus criceti]
MGDTSAVSSQINTARAVSNAANYADYGVNITQMGYNKIVKEEDPDWTRLASLGVSAVNNHNANIREARAQAGDMDFTASPVRSQQLSDIDSPHVNPADIDLPSQSGHISTVHEGTSGHAPDVAPSKASVLDAKAPKAEVDGGSGTGSTPHAKVHDLEAGAAGAVAGAKASDIPRAKVSETDAPIRAGEVTGAKGSDVTRAKATETVDSNSNDYVPFADQMSEADAQRYEQWNKYAEAGISLEDRVRVLEISEKAPKVEYLQDTYTRQEILDIKPNANEGIFRPDVEDYLDPDYIEAHRQQFENGAIKFQKFTPEEGGFNNGAIGNPGDHVAFVMPKEVGETLLDVSKGDPRLLEDLLGLHPGDLGDSPVVIDIPAESLHNVRIPSGNT